MIVIFLALAQAAAPTALPSRVQTCVDAFNAGQPLAQACAVVAADNDIWGAGSGLKPSCVELLRQAPTIARQISATGNQPKMSSGLQAYFNQKVDRCRADTATPDKPMPSKTTGQHIWD